MSRAQELEARPALRAIGALSLFLACGPSANSGDVAPAPIATVNVPPAGNAPPIAIAHEEPLHAPLAPTTLDDPARCRDPRLSAMSPRTRGLVVTEVTALKNLFDATARNAQDRPAVMRRIAEDFAELAAIASRDPSATSLRASALANAIMTYRQLKADHPAYPQIDEVTYFLALAEEEAGDLQNARISYLDLVKDSPSSKYVPYAYLAFGELFFREGASDPSKWDLASQAYNEVLKYPPPGNAVWGYAELESARVAVEKGDLPRALNAYVKTLELSEQFPQVPHASGLAEISRNEIIPVYAKSGDPDKAYTFFARVNASASEQTLPMTERLGDFYLDHAHFPEAFVLFRDLAAHDSARACKWQAYANFAKAGVGSGAAPPMSTLRAAVSACP